MAEKAPWETDAPAATEVAPWDRPQERGVLERAGEDIAGQFKEGVEATKKAYSPPTNLKEAVDWVSPAGQIKKLAGPLQATAGAAFSGAESLVTSGMAGAASKLGEYVPWVPKEKVPTTEEAYRAMRPDVSKAMLAMRPGVPKGVPYPQTSPEWTGAMSRAAPGDEATAGRMLKEAATDPVEVERQLSTSVARKQPQEIVPGSQPTTYQLTADPGLGQLERVASNVRDVQGFQARAAEQNSARLRALEDAAGTGKPQDVVDHLRAASQSEQAVADANYAAADQIARDAATQVGGAYDATVHGNVLRRELQLAEDAARANERELWQRVNPNGTLRANPQPLQELERGIYGSLTEAATASLTPVEKQISGLIQGYRPVIPFQELTDLRSLTSTAMRQERLANGQSPALGRLIRLRQGIENTLERSVFDESAQRAASAAEQVKAASAATRQRAETFNIKPIRDISRREGAQGPYRMSETAVPRAIVKPGPQGYDTASAYFRAVGNERGLPDVTSAVAADLRQAGVINEQGVADPAKLQTWARQREGVLRAISERDNGAFVGRLTNASDAARAVGEAQAAQETARAANASADLRRLTGAVSDEHVADIFGNIFGRVDSILRAQELASRLTTPAAREGAQRAIVDYVRKKFLSNAPGLGEDNLIRAEQFQNFVKQNKGALRQFLSPDQVSTIEAIATDIRRMNRSMQTKAKGGSDTAQLLYNMEKQQQSILGKFGSLVFEHAAGRIPVIGKPFKLATKVARYGKDVLREREVARIQGMVNEGLLDPARALELIKAAEPVPKQPIGAGIVYGGAQSGQQQDARAAGGDVPSGSRGGTRSPGKTTPAGARASRQGTGEALPDGRAARRHQSGEEPMRLPGDRLLGLR